MIDRVIAEYLAGKERRIVIPGLGAFIKREENNIVFLPLLTSDDGILTAELSRRLNYSPEEAATAVEKYTAQIKSDLAAGKTVVLENLGSLKKNDAGKYEFSSGMPAPAAPPKPAQAKPVQAKAKPAATQSPDKPKQVEKPAAKPAHKPTAEQAKPIPPKSASPAGAPAPAPQSAPKPAPKPVQKDTHAIITERQTPHDSREAQSVLTPRIQIQQRTKRKKKKLDTVMIVAIIAIVLAIAVIVYGQFVQRGYNLNFNLNELVVD